MSDSDDGNPEHMGGDGQGEGREETINDVDP